MITLNRASTALRTSINSSLRCYSSKNENITSQFEDKDEEFRVLNIYNKSQTTTREARRQRYKQNFVPRSQSMSTDQEWVWSGPRSFQYASVPLPLHQGYVKNASKAPPSKYANAELMKIPNFLHLTPPTISKQCEALKKFCTPWPKELKTETDQENHFPIRVITSDYVHGLPTIRNPLSRIVTIKFKLSLLNFNERERDKFLRLVDERYDPQTDEVTITTDRCPIKQQNYDYAIYLLTALYHESKNIEDWESLKVEADMEKYIWENNKSKKSATEILNWNNTSSAIVPPKEYGESVEALMNEAPKLDTKHDEQLDWQKIIERFMMPSFRFAERKKYEKGATRRATHKRPDGDNLN